MKFFVGEPAKLISYKFMFGIESRIHLYGTTDCNGILEVSDSDAYIDYLKANFTAIDEQTAQTNEITPNEIKSNTTQNSEDIEHKEDTDGNSKASGEHGIKAKRQNTSRTNAQRNGSKGRGHGTGKP